MMKTKNVFLMVLLAAQFAVNAQTINQVIRGTIIDRDSRHALPGVTVMVRKNGAQVATSSSTEGDFAIKVPVGRQDISFSMIGYKSVELTNVEVISGKETVLSIDMEESLTKIEEVTVKARKVGNEALNELTPISARSFSVEETGRYAGSRNDVSRMAANYAGVASSNDSRNDIVIRGNSPTGLLWRMDGLDIPSPNHFSGVGSNGGPVSMLNYNVISNSDFMSGAFAAEYGNALSGVFDLRLRNGNNQKREHMFQFGSLGTEFMTEGPLAKNYQGSYLVNYRFSTTSIMRALNINFGYAGRAEYQDMSFKVNLPAGKAGTFTIFGLGGTSTYQLLNKDKDPNSFDVSLVENSNQDYQTGMGVAGASHMIQLSDRSYLKTVVGVTSQREIGTIDSVDTQDSDNSIRFYTSRNYSSHAIAHTYINTKVSNRLKTRIGGIYDHSYFKINEKIYDHTIGQQRPNRVSNDDAGLVQAYAQALYSFTDELSATAGIHGQYFVLNNTRSVEPRGGLKWAFVQGQSLSLGYGIHSQLQPTPVYFMATNTNDGVMLTNRDLGFSKSQHLVIGYSNLITKTLALKVEAYNQWLWDVPVSNRPSSFSMINEGSAYMITEEDSLVNKGTGRNIGTEITLERFFDQGYHFLFTTSLFDSRYKGSDGVERNSAYNGNYIVNALAGKEFKITDNQKIVADVKVCFAGGRRYTPIDPVLSQAKGTAVLQDDLAFSRQHKQYSRLDMKVAYRLNRTRVSHEFFINIDNVLNTKNIYAQMYNKQKNELGYVYQLGMFPTVQYKISF